MALFSKPPAKKPPKPAGVVATPKPAAPAPAARRAPSAHELASQAGKKRAGEMRAVEPANAEITDASDLDVPTGQPAIEVAQANPGLCAVVENAALLFANSQVQEARLVLEDGIANDPEAKSSVLAWLALFDLLQRAGDHAAFDQLALRYVVQFERSAPIWQDSQVSAGARPAAVGGYVGLSGKLAEASAPQIEGLKRLAGKPGTQPRLDLSSVTGFDDAGARLLADALGFVRRAQVALRLERMDKLVRELESHVMQGREGGEGAWLLSLELQQWRNDQTGFDDRAVEYAVTFELSPPSWEPPAAVSGPEPAVGEAAEPPAVETESDALAWTGALTGTAAQPIASLHEFAETRAVIQLDLSRIERIDFVGAGSLLNAINRIEHARRTVQIVGATPIFRALLLLLGISPRHFVRKVD